MDGSSFVKEHKQKRSSLKMHNDIQIEDLRSKYKRLSVNWDKSSNLKSIDFHHFKTYFQNEEQLNNMSKDELYIINKRTSFEEKRKRSIKNEFIKVKEFLHTFNSEDEDNEYKMIINKKLIDENTKKNIEIGHTYLAESHEHALDFTSSDKEDE
jgi:hypothetical protein